MQRARGSARRYAEACFQVANQDGTVEAWLKDLDTTADVLAEPTVARALSNPAIPSTDRAELVERVLGKRVSQKSRNLVLLLVRRGRIDLLPAVANQFRTLYERQSGIVRATVISAKALSTGEQKQILERLADIAGGTLEITEEVDPEILGGVIVRLGDRMIDGSVRGRLERLRQRIVAGTI